MKQKRNQCNVRETPIIWEACMLVLVASRQGPVQRLI